MPKILHTADVHLGAPFRSFAAKGKELREGAKRTFLNIIKAAQEENVDLLLIAGDLVDSNRVSPATVSFIATEISKLAIPIVILPGTHDCLNNESVYHRQDWNKCKDVYIFKEELGQSFEFPQLGLAVHGRPNTSNQSATSPLLGLNPLPQYKWNIAMAHGSLQIPGKSAVDDFPITFKEIEESGMDYIALGHWHSYLGNMRHGKTLTEYCGSANTLTFGDDSGTISIVDLNADVVTVNRRKVGYYNWLTTECDTTDMADFISRHRHPQTLIKIKLKDTVAAEKLAELKQIEQSFTDAYFSLQINYTSMGQFKEVDLSQYPDTTVAGQFIMLAQEKIASAEPEDKLFWENTMKRGLAVLLSGEVD